MKKFLVAVLLALSVSSAHAISCADSLGVTFPPAQRAKLCAYFLNTASLAGPVIFSSNTGVIAAPTAISLSVGAANTPNVTYNLSGLRLSTAGMGLSMKPYVPTMAATPVSGTNDLKLGLNSVPTAAANTSACLPASPVDGDVVVVDNGMANAVRPKSCGTPGVNGGAAGTYISVAAWQRAILKYNSTLVTWEASLGTVPTPAGP